MKLSEPSREDRVMLRMCTCVRNVTCNFVRPVSPSGPNDRFGDTTRPAFGRRWRCRPQGSLRRCWVRKFGVRAVKCLNFQSGVVGRASDPACGQCGGTTGPVWKVREAIGPARQKELCETALKAFSYDERQRSRACRRPPSPSPGDSTAEPDCQLHETLIRHLTNTCS